MTARLEETVRDYLSVRRALGFKLEGTEQILAAILPAFCAAAMPAQAAGFAAHLRGAGTEHVTVQHAVEFATAPEGASRRYQALRLSAVRCFARWAHTLDPAVEVPPARLLPARPTRAAPYIYSEAEISALIAAARQLAPEPKAATYDALLSLMASTGIRTGEAVGLDVTDFDERAGTLTVTGKYGKTRMLPLHRSAAEGLAGYLEQRRQFPRGAGCPALLVSATGRRLHPRTAQAVFRGLREQAGLVTASAACRPRLHDLRHTFAVSVMLDAYRHGGDAAAVLPVLTTWLGHADPGDTFWYITGTAELLDAAAKRLQQAGGNGEGRRS